MSNWQYPMQVPVQLTQVSGIEGARAYRMPPNSAVALFHASEDVMYIKTTDGAGFPTIRTFAFSEVEDRAPEKDALGEIKEAIEDVKQLIRESAERRGAPGDARAPHGDEPAVPGLREGQPGEVPASNS